LSSLTLLAITFLSVGCIHKSHDKNDNKSKTTVLEGVGKKEEKRKSYSL
jgi:hypothetical protein